MFNGYITQKEREELRKTQKSYTSVSPGAKLVNKEQQLNEFMGPEHYFVTIRVPAIDKFDAKQRVISGKFETEDIISVRVN